MPYTHDRLLTETSLDDADPRVRKALESEGFGVLTEIDVRATMQKKLGEDMDGYLILGACNPKMAWKAMQMEPRIGAMLPCNVILRSVDGGTEVSAIDPVASMTAVDNAELHEVAGQVREMLIRAVDAA